MIFEKETDGTRHMTTTAFVDAFADMKPGEQLAYALGDIAFSTGHHQHELVELKKMAWKYAEARKWGCLTQRRHPEQPFGPRPGASFEYIITKNRVAA